MTEDPSGRERLLLLVSRLGARTAHEINNACAVLSGHLYFLRLSTESPEESYEAMETALAHVQRLSGSLARLGVLGAGDVGPVDWNEAARIASEHLGSRVALDLAEGLPRTSGRTEDARCAIEALLQNAREASPPDGEVRLSTRPLAQPTGVILTVEDSGPGIPPEKVDRALEPLSSTKGERGRGMGLAIAAAVAASVGGFCRIEPKPGGGTRATLHIPA